jgi:predicted O-methyltransferase YrrM
VRNELRRLSAHLARRLGDRTMRLGTMVGERYPAFVDDPGAALTWLDGAGRLVHSGVFDVTINVDDWAVFARHAPPGHFYSPVPSSRDVLSRADRLFDQFPDALPGIDLNEKGQEQLFIELSELLQGEELPAEPTEGWRYCAANGYYGIADALILHGMLRWLQPKRIVEIGSGWSSALILDTVDRYLTGNEHLTFVEPHPERLNELLRTSDASRVTVLEHDVQRAPVSLFSELKAGDLLFIDSSHVVTIGSDVPYLIGEVLPDLPSGVVVHVHDIFWPFEILRQWFEQGRLWAEPYMWRAFLSSNADWEILFYNHWFVNGRRSVVREHLPRMLTSGTGSLWLRRR